MRIINTNIEGCFMIEPVAFGDSRGVFMQTFHKREFQEATGMSIDFVQDNQSISARHVLRGLHFQKGEFAQAKLVWVPHGRVLDVVVDIRRGSPSFGSHLSLELSASNRLMLFIPKGLAHGFLTLEDQSVFCYKCDAYYHPESEGGIFFNDPDLNIDWGVDDSQLILSEKDGQLPPFKKLFP